MKIVSFSLGCKVNQYESDALLAILSQKGYEISEKLEFADVYILNTCAVTAEAERKSRQTITRVLAINPNAKVFVCGCASENNVEPYLLREQVVYASGTAKKMAICDAIEEHLKCQKSKIVLTENPKCDDDNIIYSNNIENIKQNNDIDKNIKQNVDKDENIEVKSSNNNDEIKNNILKNNNGIIECKNYVIDADKKFEEMGNSISPRTRHYIKVQDGCDNFCSYCIIPYLRGRGRSRLITNILKEVEFASTRTKEIVLTGINLSAYGKDIESSLANLLWALKDFDIRIRLGSLEVGIIDRELLEATKKLPAFCDHFHLSLQSGDDRVLKAMNRHYNTAEFKKAVELIREYYPEAAITTDVIVGFPTENDESFQNSKAFVKDIEFADIHIFSFSPRERTVAAKMPQLDRKLIEARHKELEKVKLDLRNNYNSKFLNQPQEVLFESKQNGYYTGHTKNYITVYRAEAKRGEISTVVCSELFNDGMK